MPAKTGITHPGAGMSKAVLSVPALKTCLELLKPVTWFAPIWAFFCGVISSGQPLAAHWLTIILGLLLAGPMVCGTSQAVNDWFDRHVDAINEPGRPIPSGRMPGHWGLYIGIIWTGVSLIVAAGLGRWGFGAAVVALALAWAYSAPPLRLKRNGWWGNAAVAICYEGVPWFTGAAIMTDRLPANGILALALLNSFGAHGIMTLNDFKSVEGDRAVGIRSLPAMLGEAAAAKLACVIMILPAAGGDLDDVAFPLPNNQLGCHRTGFRADVSDAGVCLISRARMQSGITPPAPRST